MTFLTTLQLTEEELEEIVLVTQGASFDFSGSRQDLGWLTQLLMLIYPKNIDLFLRLAKSHKLLESTVNQQHYFQTYCLTKLNELYEDKTEVGQIIDSMGKDAVSLSKSLAKNKCNDKSILPRNIPLEIYANYLTRHDRLRELKDLCEMAELQGWRGNWEKLKSKSAAQLLLEKKRNAANRNRGNFAEVAALKWLYNNQYSVAVFGKSRQINQALENVAVLPDIDVGASYAILNDSNNNLSGLSNVGSAVLPRHFDFSQSDFVELTRVCGQQFPCACYKENREAAPCYGEGSIFKDLTLEADHHIFDVGAQLKICKRRLGEVAAVDSIGSTLSNRFIRDNIRVGLYIRRFQVLVNHFDRDFEKVRAKFHFDSHPGRYDFAAYKSGGFTAFEVKSGKSPLSYWQKIRLGLLRDAGHSVAVLRVGRSFNGGMKVNREAIPDISLPTAQEIQEVLDFVHPSEQISSDVKGDTLIR